MSKSIRTITQTVRVLSCFHRTAVTCAHQRSFRPVDEALKTHVFSPENFPKVLALGISFSFLDLMAVIGWRYAQARNLRVVTLLRGGKGVAVQKSLVQSGAGAVAV